MSFLKKLLPRKDARLPNIREAVGGYARIAPALTDALYRTWGIPHVEDLTRYYNIYYTVPYIRSSIDMLADLATRNGFRYEGGNPEIRQFLETWSRRIRLIDVLREIVRLGLIYGTGYAEIIYSNPPENPPYETLRELYKLPMEPVGIGHDEDWWKSYILDDAYDTLMLQELNERGELGDILGLKTLDPRYMRVIGDSKGRVWGFVQIITGYQYLRKYQIFYWVFNRRSELYEYYYGNSLLRSILRIQTILTQLENDIALAIHFYTYTPIKAKLGNEKYRPTPEQENQIQKALESRTAGSNIIVPWFVDVEFMPQQPGIIPRMEWFFKHLLREREQAIGIPRIFFGEIGGVSRTVGEFLLDELEYKIENIRQSLTDALYMQVIKPYIYSKYGYVPDEEIPQMRWNPVIKAENRQKILALLELLRNEAISDEDKELAKQRLYELIGEPIEDNTA